MGGPGSGPHKGEGESREVKQARANMVQHALKTSAAAETATNNTKTGGKSAVRAANHDIAAQAHGAAADAHSAAANAFHGVDGGRYNKHDAQATYHTRQAADHRQSAANDRANGDRQGGRPNGMHGVREGAGFIS